jgi:hypothetical protein
MVDQPPLGGRLTPLVSERGQRDEVVQRAGRSGFAQTRSRLFGPPTGASVPTIEVAGASITGGGTVVTGASVVGGLVVVGGGGGAVLAFGGLVVGGGGVVVAGGLVVVVLGGLVVVVLGGRVVVVGGLVVVVVDGLFVVVVDVEVPSGAVVLGRGAFVVRGWSGRRSSPPPDDVRPVPPPSPVSPATSEPGAGPVPASASGPAPPAGVEEVEVVERRRSRSAVVEVVGRRPEGAAPAVAVVEGSADPSGPARRRSRRPRHRWSPGGSRPLALPRPRPPRGPPARRSR